MIGIDRDGRDGDVQGGQGVRDGNPTLGPSIHRKIKPLSKCIIR